MCERENNMRCAGLDPQGFYSHVHFVLNDVVNKEATRVMMVLKGEC